VELKFLTLCKLSAKIEWVARWCNIHDGGDNVYYVARIASYEDVFDFPMIAQSFAEICRERPELQPFYDRAKAAAQSEATGANGSE
jgi:hypothetical protein